jgi:Helix-turn-helix
MEMSKNRTLKVKIIEKYGSQWAASRDFQISEQRLSRLVTGRDRPKEHELQVLSKKLGVPPDELAE